jgi:hypothetical protein
MLNKGAVEVAGRRGDLSRFLVHLTRNNKADFGADGRSARGSFIAIWNSRKIRARKVHCLHQKRMREQPVGFRRKFSVCCFSETPLSQVSELLDIPDRQVNLAPYGFVFPREFLVRKGAQQVHYINRYAGSEQSRAADRVFWTAVESECGDPTWRLIPFWSAMDERCDFSWEREWRILGPMRFEREDLACVILPAGDTLWGVMNRAGVAVIDPEWSHEEVIDGMARQIRDMKADLEVA